MAFKIGDLPGLAELSLQAHDRTAFWDGVIAATNDADLVAAINLLDRSSWPSNESRDQQARDIRDKVDNVKEAIQELQAAIPEILIRTATVDEYRTSEVDVTIGAAP